MVEEKTNGIRHNEFSAFFILTTFIEVGHFGLNYKFIRCCHHVAGNLPVISNVCLWQLGLKITPPASAVDLSRRKLIISERWAFLSVRQHSPFPEVRSGLKYWTKLPQSISLSAPFKKSHDFIKTPGFCQL